MRSVIIIKYWICFKINKKVKKDQIINFSILASAVAW